MTNREWLRSKNNKELARLINKNDTCDYCIRNLSGDCDSERCESSEYCEEGIVEWLNAKHEESMPKIKAGDIIMYEYKGQYLPVLALCVGDNIVCKAGSNSCVNFDDSIIKESTIAIKRYNTAKGTMEYIWRADSEEH